MQGATAAKEKKEGGEKNAAGQISSVTGKGEIIIAETIIKKKILLLQENLDQG